MSARIKKSKRTPRMPKMEAKEKRQLASAIETKRMIS
jgi:hypothetical protein